jgi:diaminopimelate epimerase
MKIEFHKYQGTGNDFIIIDNRTLKLDPPVSHVALMCDRHFGIGADGLILLNEAPGFDFGMRYYNSDGKESTMCGNGGRCITAFVASMGIIEEKAHFMASDGEHCSVIIGKNCQAQIISLKMRDVKVPVQSPDRFFIHTGSPHYVLFAGGVEKMDILPRAREIRYSPEFAGMGTNVDFVEVFENELFVRTYERGVEGETLSCGTGVVAAALASSLKANDNRNHWLIRTPGGRLKVGFTRDQQKFTEIWLEGQAKFVFSGEIEI